MSTSAELFLMARHRHQSGDVAGAALLYQQVLERYPTHVQALGFMALACQQRGQMAEAEHCYRRILALQPDDVETHFKLGLLLASMRRPVDAAIEFRETVRLRPDAAEAWNNLGNSLFVQEKVGEAIVCYREAVRLKPAYPEACLNLGKALREDDQVNEGLTWYREAVRLKPDYAKARNDLAAALLEMGNLQEAELHFRECLQLNPASPRVLCTLAANGLYADSDPTTDELERRLGDSTLSLMDRSLVHSTIGYVFDRGKNYDAAFPHFQEGHRLRSQQLRQEGVVFDSQEHSRFIDRLVAVFDENYFTRVSNFGLDWEAPVFIVGMPRSGSSLVEQILSHHPDIEGAGELRDIPRLADSLSQQFDGKTPYPDCASLLDATIAQRLAETYCSRVKRLVAPARRITDKMLDNFIHLGLIATLFPKARVIHCIRDPLDVCTSCYLQIFRGLHFARDLHDLGRYYKEYERLMAHWRTALPLPLMDVVYEELVADPQGVSRRLIEFCRLTWDERCLRFHENPRAVRTVSKLQVRQPVFASSIGRWRRYAGHLGPLRRALGDPSCIHSDDCTCQEPKVC
jgi:Flp pilus assembly protein TadD